MKATIRYYTPSGEMCDDVVDSSRATSHIEHLRSRGCDVQSRTDHGPFTITLPESTNAMARALAGKRL